jgi:hypothetical protein
LYAYQNPTVYVDPDGREATPWFHGVVNEHSDVFRTQGTIDTGNQFKDVALAIAYSGENALRSTANYASVVSNAPIHGWSKMSGRTFEQAEGDAMALFASNPVGIGVGGAYNVVRGKPLRNLFRGADEAVDLGRNLSRTESVADSGGMRIINDVPVNNPAPSVDIAETLADMRANRVAANENFDAGVKFGTEASGGLKSQVAPSGSVGAMKVEGAVLEMDPAPNLAAYERMHGLDVPSSTQPSNNVNWKGAKVETYEGHQWSPLDPKMSEPPIVNLGAFTEAQRSAFLKGKSGGTKIAPHHRHQLPTETHGGVIDELRGPGHPDGNNHTALVDGLNRHPGESYFNKAEGGKAQRAREIREHFRQKGERLVSHPTEPKMWVDLGT